MQILAGENIEKNLSLFDFQELQKTFASFFRNQIVLEIQSNLSIVDMLYNGHPVIVDTFLRN